MCNLYRMQRTTAEVAKWFGASETTASNHAQEVYPGYSALVFAGDRLRSMVWGFPLARRSEKTGKPLKPKPVNNARSDRLDSAFWRASFADRRCLIPVTQWCEAEGEKGHMTRTWLRVSGQPLFAVAAVWRSSDEWGDVCSMVMVDASPAVRPVHHRMPLVLSPDQYDRWQNAGPEDALSLCQPSDLPIEIDRTETPWFRR